MTTMKTELLSTFASKVILGVATAASVAGGSAIISAQRDNAVQDQRLNQVEDSLGKIDHLSDQLTEANINMAVLRDRLDREVTK